MRSFRFERWNRWQQYRPYSSKATAKMAMSRLKTWVGRKGAKLRVFKAEGKWGVYQHSPSPKYTIKSRDAKKYQ